MVYPALTHMSRP